MSKRNRQATKKAAEGASGSGRQQPDSKSLPNGIGKAKQSAEWVAEIPVDAQSGEEVDACGDYMSHVFRLAEVIRDPDLNIWADIRKDRSGAFQWYMFAESNLYKRRVIEEAFFKAYDQWQRSKATQK